MYNLKQTLSNLHLPKRQARITVGQAKKPGGTVGAGQYAAPVRQKAARTSNLAPSKVVPAAFTTTMGMGAPQAQPSTGEILPNPQFIPSESRSPINDSANPNTPHGIKGAIPTVRV